MPKKPKKWKCWYHQQCCCFIPLRWGVFLIAVFLTGLNVFLLIEASNCETAVRQLDKDLQIPGYWCSTEEAEHHVPVYTDLGVFDLERVVWEAGRAFGISFSCCGWTRYGIFGFCIIHLVLNAMLLIGILITPTLLIQLCLQQLMYSALLCHIFTYGFFTVAVIITTITYLISNVYVGVFAALILTIFLSIWAYFLCLVYSYHKSLDEDILPKHISADAQDFINGLPPRNIDDNKERKNPEELVMIKKSHTTQHPLLLPDEPDVEALIVVK